MKSFLLMTMVIMFSGSSAFAVNYSVDVVNDSTIVINLPQGDTADSLKVVQFPELQTLRHFAKLANDGQVVVTVQPVKSGKPWKAVQRMKNISKEERNRLNGMYDAAALNGRFENGVRILKELGLTALVVEDAGAEVSATPAIIISYRSLKKVYDSAELLTLRNALSDTLKDFRRELDESKRQLTADKQAAFDLLSKSKPSFSAGLQVGLGTTEHGLGLLAVAPVFYKRLMIEPYGIHSLRSTDEFEFAGREEESFDRGGGALLGFRLAGPLYAVAGYHGEETIVDTGEFAGDRRYSESVGQFGLQIAKRYWSAQVLATYGSEKEWDQGLHSNWGGRAGITVGFFGGK